MKLCLVDLDAMLHIVAYSHWKAGNRDKKEIVKSHVRRFTSTIEKNSGCTHSLRFFQTLGHQNYRKELLPEYKSDRVSTEWVAHWKPTIVEAFTETNAIPLTVIESDDAISIIKRASSIKEVVVISSDKDMRQVPCTLYDPFNSHKGKVHDPKRWFTSTEAFAEKFFWEQVLSGDSTDMPGTLCGIEGVGPTRAFNAINSATISPQKVVQDLYTKKYGVSAGFKRADITYKMVKLLEGNETYLNDAAKSEIKTLLDTYESYIQPITSGISELFTNNSAAVDLFKKR